MCWLTSVQHRCTHWGRPEVESQCAIGDSLNLRTGCWDSTTQGVKQAHNDCSACRNFGAFGRNGGECVKERRGTVVEVGKEGKV